MGVLFITGKTRTVMPVFRFLYFSKKVKILVTFLKKFLSL
mgnify:CR=1 FL=1